MSVRTDDAGYIIELLERILEKLDEISAKLPVPKPTNNKG